MEENAPLSSNNEPFAEDRSAQTRPCAYCLEDIHRDKRKCPFCGSPQGVFAVLTTGLKWVAALLTVLTLVFGIRQLVILGQNLVEQHTHAQLRVKAARALVKAGEYESAWRLLEPVAASADATVRTTRMTVARGWLLHAHALEGRTTFLDLTDKVAPVIAGATAEGTPRQRAEMLALLGYAQFLRARVEGTPPDVADYYRRALAIDADCGLAHVLLGGFLAGWTDAFQEGLQHLQRAVELSRAGQLQDVSVRERQLQAILNHMHVNPYVPNPAYNEGVTALVRVLNNIRREGGTLPEVSVSLDKNRRNRYEVEARSIYHVLPGDEAYTAPLRQAIPLDEHAALLQWLQTQSDAAPDPWLTAWTAYFQEQQGNTADAIATYRQVAEPPDRLTAIWQAAMLRLTGEAYQPLSQRDPWEHLAQVLGTAVPDSDAFRTALGELEEYMDEHRLGARYAEVQALRAAQAAFDNLSARASRHESAVQGEDLGLAQVGLALGQLLLAAKRPQAALVVLEGLPDDAALGRALRGEIRMAQAVAHAQQSTTASGGERELDIAVTRLRTAVDQVGYADWARIRWFDDLRPVRARPGFAALLREHGRTVDGLFKGERRHGR